MLSCSTSTASCLPTHHHTHAHGAHPSSLRFIRVICFPCNLTFELLQGRQDLRNRRFNSRKIFLRNAPHSPQISSLVVMNQHISESCHQPPGNRSMHSPKLFRNSLGCLTDNLKVPDDCIL